MKQSITHIINKLIIPIVLLILLSPPGFGQDPLKVAPESYKLALENEWVKVTQVHYAPHAKIAAHNHTETGAAYVYLNDGGPVIFKHISLDYGAITRPATKTGSVRLYKAVKEVHEVENPNDTPSDFLRVEFKTAIDPDKSLRGKFHREIYKAGEDFQKIHYENEQIRMTRLACAKICELSSDSTMPTLIVALTSFKLSKGGKLELGKPKWIMPGTKQTIKNSSVSHAELLRFDFKTKPVESNEKGNSHEHVHE